MKEKIIAFIKDDIANETVVDIDVREDLLGNGLIDSIGLIKLISFLQEEFQVEVPAEDMTVENFMTVQNIMDYISSK